MSYKFLDSFERRLRPYAIPHLTEGIILVQAIFFVGIYAYPDANLLEKLVLSGQHVREKGEWWRIFSFLFLPGSTHPLWAFFGWYIFWVFGSALDSQWGTAKYNLYLLIGWVAHVILALSIPYIPVFNWFLEGTVFFAFAVLYPNHTLLLFFVLPVEVKWLAMIGWGALIFFYARSFGLGETLGSAVRWGIQVGVLNFMLFFAKDIAQRLRGIRRGIARKAELTRTSGQPFHRCAVCGKTDKSDPKEEFRYCPECHGAPGYCSAHIFNHAHIKPPDAQPVVAAKPAKPKREKW